MAKTFSESWYQVAQLQVGLLPTVKVHKQQYRGQVWYVLQDSCSDKYYRVQELGYKFLASLDHRKTIEQAWLDFIDANPHHAPSQDDVIALLSQMHQMSLLYFRSESQSDEIFRRFKKQKTKEKLTHLIAFIYFRLPLLNPNDFLKKNIKWLAVFFTLPAFLVWLFFVFLGAKSAIDNADQFLNQAQGVLSVDNLLWLFVGMFVLKIFHELGHAIVCRKYGGDVHTMGLMFIAFAPLPYLDASSSWSLRNKWQRAFVGAAGMYVELFFAAVAAIIWSQTSPGFVNSMAFNIMIIGSVSSLLFNGNPLLKFDAYYILSDVIDVPNLYQKSIKQWFYLGNILILGTQNPEEPASENYERRWFYSYGLLSFFYRLFVMTIILLYLADISLFLGVLMVMALSYMWLIGPTFKLIKYLAKSSELMKNRSRAVYSALGMLSLVVIFLVYVPVHNRMTLPGVIENLDKQVIFAQGGGTLLSLVVESGQAVTQGDIVYQFSNPELELERETARFQLVEVQLLIRQSLVSEPQNLKALEERKDFLEQRILDLENRVERLTYRAETDGIWVTNLRQEHIGTYYKHLHKIGHLISGETYRFIAVVPQEKSASLFEDAITGGDLKLSGQMEKTILVDDVNFIPYQTHTLRSQALAIQGGGSIFAQPNERGQFISDEPFFELIARLDSKDNMPLQDGRLGYLRVYLDSKPIFFQFTLYLKQLLQSRYSVSI